VLSKAIFRIPAPVPDFLLLIKNPFPIYICAIKSQISHSLDLLPVIEHWFFIHIFIINSQPSSSCTRVAFTSHLLSYPSKISAFQRPDLMVKWSCLIQISFSAFKTAHSDADIFSCNRAVPVSWMFD
jgi:hypothetical protein